MPPWVGNEVRHKKEIEMLTWCVKFSNLQTGEQQYREYPQMAQWSTRAVLNNFLQIRQFLQDFVCSDIQLLDTNNLRLEMAEMLGRIVYAR